MCDTLVALGSATASGRVIFAKNSDREPGEAQGLVYRAAARHRAQETVRCTYLEIPQAPETHAVLLSKPFWTFGAEMGANDHGVVIGNEAVFTKMPIEETGLLGMDLLRLALERADTAASALDTIIEMLERYGQGGACGYRDKRFRYHNAFLIADPHEAWVLETAGRQWAAQKVRDVRAISNGLSIGRDFDRCSSGLVRTAIERGWCRTEAEFDFARCYAEPVYTWFSASRARRERLTCRLEARRGTLTVADAMAFLTDHGEAGEADGWTPEAGLFMQVCAHGAWGPIRGGGAQTVGSMVSELSPDSAVHWLTGTSAPCTGVFKPVWLEGWGDGGAALERVLGPEPGPRFAPSIRWWAHERLHHAALEDYATRRGLYREERASIQQDLLRSAAGARGMPEFVEEAFRRADEATAGWTARLEQAPRRRRPGWLYRRFWAAQRRLGGMG